MNIIMQDHSCETVMNPLEIYYCECSGPADATFPTLKFTSNDAEFVLEPQAYLLYEHLEPNEPALCMVGFQEEKSTEYAYWLLGDVTLRAFYSIYDAENKQVGFVGNINTLSVSQTDSEEDNSDNSLNIILYIVPSVICLLCVLAIIISVYITIKLRKSQLKKQN